MTRARARELFRDAGTAALRVGVFGPDDLHGVGRTAGEIGLDVIQLHGDPSVADVQVVRARFGGKIWAVARAERSALPQGTEALFREADAVLVDTRLPGAWGGTGETLEWGTLARALDDIRGTTPLVLAGGLTPENVARAVRLVSPDVVDVSSGVESAPGIKDHERMRAFIRAAQERPM